MFRVVALGLVAGAAGFAALLPLLGLPLALVAAPFVASACAVASILVTELAAAREQPLDARIARLRALVERGRAWSRPSGRGLSSRARRPRTGTRR